MRGERAPQPLHRSAPDAGEMERGRVEGVVRSAPDAGALAHRPRPRRPPARLVPSCVMKGTELDKLYKCVALSAPSSPARPPSPLSAPTHTHQLEVALRFFIGEYIDGRYCDDAAALAARNCSSPFRFWCPPPRPPHPTPPHPTPPPPHPTAPHRPLVLPFPRPVLLAKPPPSASIRTFFLAL